MFDRIWGRWIRPDHHYIEDVNVGEDIKYVSLGYFAIKPFNDDMIPVVVDAEGNEWYVGREPHEIHIHVEGFILHRLEEYSPVYRAYMRKPEGLWITKWMSAVMLTHMQSQYRYGGVDVYRGRLMLFPLDYGVPSDGYRAGWGVLLHTQAC